MYYGFGVAFDARQNFCCQMLNLVKMLLFLVQTVVHRCMLITKKQKKILVLGDDPSEGLDNTTITAEAKYYIGITG